MTQTTPLDAERMRVLLELLRKKDVVFESGLTPEELAHVENIFTFRFPPDLRLLLNMALPVQDHFIHWRQALTSEAYRTDILRRIATGLEEMVEAGKQLHEEMGISFDGTDTAPETNPFPGIPRLIPIYGRRYIPETPHEAANPVYSIFAADMIYYGFDLASYFRNEFHITLPAAFKVPDRPKITPFWGTLAT